MRAKWLIPAVLLLLATCVQAQSSPSFRLEEYTLNAGGMPSRGQQLGSASFTLTLASIGESVAAAGPAGASFGMDAGFDAAYPPPGEVASACGSSGGACMVFLDGETLSWPAEPSAGLYDLYRDSTADDFGECEQRDVLGTMTLDTSMPPSGGGYFYLVTAKNRLGEEGTKGFQSDTSERPASGQLPVCP